MGPPLRLVFLGSDIIALPLLNWLGGAGAAVAEVVAVFTQPDRAVGRGQQVVANGIKTWALQRGVPVYQPEKLTEESRQQLAALAPDVSLVMAYGHILRDPFIATPRLGTLNLHASILPKYRGASPIQTAIASGEKETGVSLMRIVRRLDAGPVADVERVVIDKLDTAREVEEKLSEACLPLLKRGLPALSAGQLVFQDQDESAAVYCRKLVKDDGALDFKESALALAARINGLFPWPGCVVPVNGQSIKIGLADVIDGASAQNVMPGTIVGSDSEGVLVATTQGCLRLRRLQRPGGKMLSAGDFLRGFPLAIGTLLESKEMPALAGLQAFKG